MGDNASGKVFSRGCARCTRKQKGKFGIWVGFQKTQRTAVLYRSFSERGWACPWMVALFSATSNRSDVAFLNNLEQLPVAGLNFQSMAVYRSKSKFG